MRDRVEERVRRLVGELFLGGEASGLEPDTDLVGGGICDSFGLVRLAAALESSFPGLRIHDQDINPATMGSIRAISVLVHESGVAS